MMYTLGGNEIELYEYEKLRTYRKLYTVVQKIYRSFYWSSLIAVKKSIQGDHRKW